MGYIIFGIILIIIGCILSFFTINFLLIDPIINRHGVETFASVLKVKKDSDGILNVKIKYSYNDKKYTDYLMANEEQDNLFYQGNTINIKLNPKNPLLYKLTDEVIHEPTFLGIKKSILKKLFFLFCWFACIILPGIAIIIENI